MCLTVHQWQKAIAPQVTHFGRKKKVRDKILSSLCCHYCTGMFIRTTGSWSWPVRAKKMLMHGKPPFSELEFILNGSR